MGAAMDTEYYVTPQTLVGQEAPDFTAKACVGNDIVDYTLSENGWKAGKYTVLFFYPKDFTFVCPTEIIAFSDAAAKFEERNVQLVGASVDNEHCKYAWKQLARNEGGLGTIEYPLVADVDHSISQDYGVESEGGAAYRGLFLIDTKGIVRHTVVNDMPLGRSVEETLRMVDALQFFETNGEVCPANWTPGKATIKANQQESREYFASAN
jgi:alkyl hydroperoxide reductase subunit AhpC